MIVFSPYFSTDIQQLNLIMDVLGTPPDDFMSKISSESVSKSSDSFYLIVTKSPQIP